MIKYRHIKTGNIYLHLGFGIDATNERDGIRVIIYCPDDNKNSIYVREEKEFYDRFENVS